MNSQELLVKEILLLAAKSKVPLYGGAVRDSLRNEIPNDLDFLFRKGTENEDMLAFKDELTTTGLIVKNLYETHYGFGRSIRFQLKSGAFTMKIDLCRDESNECVCQKIGNIKESCHCNPGSRCFDFDVNQLTASIDEEGNLVNISLHPRFKIFLLENPQHANLFSLEKIQEHVIRKEFRIIHNRCAYLKYMEAGKLKERIDRMIERGWRCLNRRCCENPDCYGYAEYQIPDKLD